jgi:D-3-phosphoglycerate dehydrogenase / 2-oxoglutarate reductase
MVNTKPLIVCAADLQHVPKARRILEGCGRVQYIDTEEETLATALAEADAYFATLRVQLTRELMAQAPKLRVVVTPSTGLDHIDLGGARELGIVVLGLKEDRELLDRITATAELAWALILACARRLPEAVGTVHQGRWSRDQLRGSQIAYKTLGILGCGRLGTMVAEYGRAFRMKVIGCDRGKIDLPGVEQVSFEQLLRESDVLTVHIHLTEENRGLVNRDTLAAMKHGAILVNTSRGAIIDEAALLEALRHGPLKAAGLDVIDGEWRKDLAEHPLIVYARSHHNLIITPHVGGVTFESQEMAFDAAATMLADYLKAGTRS